MPKRILNCNFLLKTRSDKGPVFLPADLLLKGLFVFNLSPALCLRYKEVTEDHLDQQKAAKNLFFVSDSLEVIFPVVFTV